jgi:hypothetical protein
MQPSPRTILGLCGERDFILNNLKKVRKKHEQFRSAYNHA